MRKYEHYPEFHDFFEYCGTNEIKRVRIKGGQAVRRDWFVFESIDEAVGFFRRVCGTPERYCTGTSSD
jgi:hypothetical protein